MQYFLEYLDKEIGVLYDSLYISPEICYSIPKERTVCAVEHYFQMNRTKQQVDAVSNLGLAHMGDAVYEVLCRSYLCARGDLTVGKLHKDTVSQFFIHQRASHTSSRAGKDG